MPYFTCQHCGHRNEYHVTVGQSHSDYGASWPNVRWQREWTHSRTYADSAQRPRFGDTVEAAAPPPDIKEATRDTPARAPAPEDFWNPFKRAVVMGWLGLMLGVLVGIKTPHVVFRDDLFWMGVFSVSFFGGTFILFTFLSDKSIWIREKIEGRDIDGDGEKGRPDFVQYASKREDDEGDRWKMGRLPCPNGQIEYLENFCQAIIDGYANFSERGSRKGSKDPKKGAAHFGYHTRLWEKLRDEFIAQGWAEWRGEGRQGVGLTEEGQEQIELIAAGETVP